MNEAMMREFETLPWKKVHGRPAALGFIGPDVPVEVLLLSGRPFGHLPWNTEPTPWADRWLESGFPGWARSILQQWRDGAFDDLQVVVFSRGDDASQRLFYYIRELQLRGELKGPQSVVFDIALIPRESSLAHTAEAVLTLAQQLGVDAQSLPRGIELGNVLRRKLAALQQQRVGQGDHYARLARAALWSDASTWLDDRPAPSHAAAHRVLLAGSTPPDDRLHLAVEAAGASVIDEAHMHGLDRLGPPIAASDETPQRAIARQLRLYSTGPRACIDRARWLVDRARSTRAAAVILWLTREDEALAWQVPAQRKALADAGIPALVLPAAHWLANDGALERITDFCRETFR